MVIVSCVAVLFARIDQWSSQTPTNIYLHVKAAGIQYRPKTFRLKTQ